LPVSAATYTHNLNYSHQTGDGDEAFLSGQITFDDAVADDDQLSDIGGFTTINRDLITNITFTYTPSGGGAQNLVADDIAFVRIDFINNGTTDFSVANFQSQVSVMQFRTAFGDSDPFALIQADDFYAQQAGGNDDFSLDSTIYHSPGPLPLFGLFTAFSSIKKLKSKYKKKYNF